MNKVLIGMSFKGAKFSLQFHRANIKGCSINFVGIVLEFHDSLPLLTSSSKTFRASQSFGQRCRPKYKLESSVLKDISFNYQYFVLGLDLSKQKFFLQRRYIQ